MSMTVPRSTHRGPLDFFLAEVAPSVHNAAIERAQAYVRDRLADLDGACTLPEFGYWTQRR